MALKAEVGIRCIQYMLFTINFMFVMVGTLLITTASTILVAYKEFDVFIESHYFKPAEIFIAIGVITVAISFLGGIAAIKQSTMLINAYALSLIILLILEVSGAITAFVMRNSIYHSIENNMMDTMVHYKMSEYAKTSWDYTQQRLQCCGVRHPDSWAPFQVKGPAVHDSGLIYTIPYSCCTEWPCEEINVRGCLSTLDSYMSNIAFTIVYVTVVVEIAQCLGLVFACMLTKTIRRLKTQEEMERQQLQHRFYSQIVNEQEQRANPVASQTPSSTDA